MSITDRSARRSSELPLTPQVPALAAVLANQVVVELCRFPGPVTPRLILHNATKVANRGGWKGYRGGRQRLAGWAGTYARWFAPGEGWQFTATEAIGQTWASWTDGDQTFVDVVAPGDSRDLDRRSLAETATEILDELDCDAVRVLTVSAPLNSRVFTADGPAAGIALGETDLAFGSAVA